MIKINLKNTFLSFICFSFISCGDVVNNSGTNISDGIALSDFRIFISSVSYSGDLGGSNGADDKCDALAKAQGLTREYIALISDQSTDVKMRFVVTSGKVYIFRGDNDPIVIVDSLSDLWSGNDLLNKINYDEKFKLLDSFQSTHVSPWTGSNSDGFKQSDNCQGWTSDNSVFSGWTGSSDTKTTSWIEANTITCNIQRPIYCISKEI